MDTVLPRAAEVMAAPILGEAAEGADAEAHIAVDESGG